ncbi:MAG: tetratricopeptide repeat protein [Candidatus Latescibacteria bacterium]|nr:tetratricopeptide repeat protein [Candidatus Latescibacterota bacterium]
MRRYTIIQRRASILLMVFGVVLVSTTSCFLWPFGSGGNGLGKEEKGKPTPRGPIMTFEVASTLRDAGRYEEALKVYQQAVESDPTSPVAADALREIGGIYVQMFDYQKAIDTYQTLLTKFPSYRDAETVKKRIEFAQVAQRVLEERKAISSKP